MQKYKKLILCLLAAVASFLTTSCEVRVFPPQGGGYGGGYGGYGGGCRPQQPYYGQPRGYRPPVPCGGGYRPQPYGYQRPYYGSAANPIRMGYAQFSDQNPGGYW